MTKNTKKATKKATKATKAAKVPEVKIARTVEGHAGLLVDRKVEISKRGLAAQKNPLFAPGKVYSKTFKDSKGVEHTIKLECRADGYYVGTKRYDTPTSATQDFCVNVLGWSPKARRPPAALFGLWKSPNAPEPKPAKAIKKSKKQAKADRKAAKVAKKPAAKRAAKPAPTPAS